MSKSLLAALAAITALSACYVQTVSPAKGRIEGCDSNELIAENAIAYCGSLDGSFELFLKNNLTANTTQLLVTSAGGNIPIAIEAARLVNAIGVEVVVRDYCLSACAQFLFIPAKKGFLEKGAIVALHTTNTSLGIARSRTDWAEYELFKKSFAAGIQQEREFYEESSISTDLLIDPFRAMQPACIFEKIDWSTPLGPTVEYRSQALWWIPSESWLLRYGMPAKGGYWPSSIAEISEIGKKAGRLGVKGVAINPPNAGPSVEQLANLPKCEELLQK
jgi:hypothetical protein